MFTPHDVKIKNESVQGCSLDKYLTLDAWSQIYIKLEHSIERASRKSIDELKEETFFIRRAQLELSISYKKSQLFHADIIKEEGIACDMYDLIMVIKIEMKSDLSSYKNLKKTHSSKSLKSDDKTSAKTSANDIENGVKKFTSHSSNEELKGEKNSEEDHDEYIPSARTHIDSNVSYTPSKLSQCHAKTEEYAPAAVSDVTNAVLYSPMKIDGGPSPPGKVAAPVTSDTAKKPFTIPKKVSKETTKYLDNISPLLTTDTNNGTDFNKNDYVDKTKPLKTQCSKLNISTDLFGEDDDDDDNSIEPRYSVTTRQKSFASKKGNSNLNKITNWAKPTHLISPSSDDNFSTENQKRRKVENANEKSKLESSNSNNSNGKHPTNGEDMNKKDDVSRMRALRILMAESNKRVEVDKIL